MAAKKKSAKSKVTRKTAKAGAPKTARKPAKKRASKLKT